MNGFRPDRREFLALAGTGLVGAIAGCAEPQSADSMEGSSSHSIADTIDSDDRADGSTFTDVYEAVIDSVAQVRALGAGSPYSGERGGGQGSGFLIDGSHLVTNEHVVADADTVDLQYINGDWSDTEIVGTDFYSDLAVLKVDRVPDEATPLELAAERSVVGQEVLAVGNPYGFQGSMSKGIVSGVNRTLDMQGRTFSFSNAIQTDAAVNPGNSGGPLVNVNGEVVGIITAGGGDNIGFAIPAAIANRVVPSLIETGTYEHSYVGITLATVDRYIAEANDLSEATGVIVTGIEPGGPADGVLRPATPRPRDSIPVGGDVIYAIDGHPIPDRHALSSHLALRTSPGDAIEIECRRYGDETTESLTLGARPSAR